MSEINLKDEERTKKVLDGINELLKTYNCTLLVKEEKIADPFKQAEQKAISILVVPLKEENAEQDKK